MGLRFNTQDRQELDTGKTQEPEKIDNDTYLYGNI